MKAVRSPPCAQGVFCVCAHRLREAIGRHVRRGRTCRYGGFASGGAAAAWRDIVARSRSACHCAANISRNSGKDARKPAFRGLSAAVGVRIFFRAAEARRIFPQRRAGREKCVAGVFGACGGVPVARFPFSDKDWSFRDGAGRGILRPIFREISAERGADRENN